MGTPIDDWIKERLSRPAPSPPAGHAPAPMPAPEPVEIWSSEPAPESEPAPAQAQAPLPVEEPEPVQKQNFGELLASRRRLRWNIYGRYTQRGGVVGDYGDYA